MQGNKHKKPYKKVLIVLGCSRFINGMPKIMMERIRKAIILDKKENYNKIILSGGKNKMPISEAEIMKIIMEKEISSDRIILERNSKDTVQNAVFCWEILHNKDVEKITILTSDYHLRRTKYIFDKVFKHTRIPLRFETTRHILPPILSLRLFFKELFLNLQIRIQGIK